MSRFTLKDLARRVLREEKRPLTAEKIWEIAKQKGYDKLGNFRGKTPWLYISTKIHVDIRDDPESPFVMIDSKPKKFFLKSLVPESELKKIKEKEKGEIEEPKKVKYLERDIHPFLTYFAYTHMNVYTKTLYHEKSSKRRYSQ